MNEDRNALWVEEVNKLSPLGQYLAHIDCDKHVTVVLLSGHAVAGRVGETETPRLLALGHPNGTTYIDVENIAAFMVREE